MGLGPQGRFRPTIFVYSEAWANMIPSIRTDRQTDTHTSTHTHTHACTPTHTHTDRHEDSIVAVDK